VGDFSELAGSAGLGELAEKGRGGTISLSQSIFVCFSPQKLEKAESVFKPN
jgi:hypothetical protein